MPTSESSRSFLSFPGFPTYSPWSIDRTAIAGRLAEIGCDVMRKYVDRNLTYLRSLSEVREPTQFVEGYQAFLKTLWDDQAEALRAAGQVLREGLSPAPEAAPETRAPKAKPAGTVRKVASSTTSKPTASKPAAPAKPAAGAKPEVAKPAPPASKTAASPSLAAVFELYRDDSGAHRFRLKTADGGLLLTSQGYKSRASALNGIEAVRRNAPVEARYVVPEDNQGKPCFNLRAGNNQVIATSAEFTSTAEREAAMAAVRTAARSARVA